MAGRKIFVLAISSQVGKVREKCSRILTVLIGGLNPTFVTSDPIRISLDAMRWGGKREMRLFADSRVRRRLRI